MKRITAVVCVVAMLISHAAFAYKRDEKPKDSGAAEKQQETTEQEYEYEYKPKGHSLMTAGYVLIALGGSAAIAGSVLAAATSKKTAGVIVGASGAALGLAGSLVILLGSTSHGDYGVAPAINPEQHNYGLAFVCNF